MSTTARNVLIVLALAVAVYAIPGGGETADFVAKVLGILITGTFAFMGYRFYRERRVDIFSLGDRHRVLLYGAIGGIVFALAVRIRMFESAAGTLAWVAILGACGYALYLVYQHYRSFSY